MTVGSFPMQRLSTQGMQHAGQMAFVHDFVARQVGGLHLHPVDKDNIAMDLEAMTRPDAGRPRQLPADHAQRRP